MSPATNSSSPLKRDVHVCFRCAFECVCHIPTFDISTNEIFLHCEMAALHTCVSLCKQQLRVILRILSLAFFLSLSLYRCISPVLNRCLFELFGAKLLVAFVDITSNLLLVSLRYWQITWQRPSSTRHTGRGQSLSSRTNVWCRQVHRKCAA